MPLLKHAVKKMRQDTRRRELNRNQSAKLKTITKQALENPSPESVSKAYSALDKASKRGLIHKNTAARKKALLAKRLKLQKKSSAKIRARKK